MLRVCLLPYVVVVHGFAASRRILSPLVRRLNAASLQAEAYSYPSVTHSVQYLACGFAKFLRAHPSAEPMHIVAHSMGSVVVRTALRQLEPTEYGRIVFLASPNTGSPLTHLVPRFLDRWLLPIHDLRPNSEILRSAVTPNESRFATITGRFDLHVPRRYALCHTGSNHATLNLTHNGLLFSRRVAEMVTRFVQSGELAIAG